MSVGVSLSAAEKARGRSYLYDLLAETVLRGTAPHLRAHWEALPPGAHLPAPHEAGVRHEALFGQGVQPYQGVFLAPDGLLGGAGADRLPAEYRAGGYVPGVEAEHAAAELGYLAHLAAAEADACEDRREGIARQVQALAGRFLAGQLLRWLPPLHAAVHAHGDPFYSGLIDLAAAALADQAAALGCTAAGFTLPPPPGVGGTGGVDEIAVRLLRPAYSGLYLSRADLRRLGRRLELPLGFGPRQDMLAALLHSAGRFEQFDALAAGLLERVAEAQAFYAALAGAQRSLAPFVAVWQERSTATAALLEELRTAAGAV